MNTTISKFSKMSARNLKQLKEPLVVFSGQSPKLVVVPYATYLRVQNQIIQAQRMIEFNANELLKGAGWITGIASAEGDKS